MLPLTSLELRREAGSFSGDVDRTIEAFLERVARGEVTRPTVRTRTGRLIAQANAPIPGGGWVTTHEDVTEREQVAARISHAAHHDVLTGLANRASLKAHVEEALGADTVPPFAVLLIDLDRFKAVNDTFGHAIGDALLVEVARRISSCVPATAGLARLGGDEFAILLDGDAATGLEIANCILTRMQVPMQHAGHHLALELSMSIAPLAASAPEEAMTNADLALRAAKVEGRKRSVLFAPEMRRMNACRVALAGQFHDALSRSEFELFYQPQIRLADGSVAGMEALLRWRHPERGLLPPADFLPLADETGLGEAIFGAVLLGSATSIAGITTSVTAAVNALPSLAISNAIGGIAAQTVFLAVADITYRPANLEHAAASAARCSTTG